MVFGSSATQIFSLWCDSDVHLLEIWCTAEPGFVIIIKID